jgi:hypothetical protein
MLRTFGCIEWECEFYSGRPKARWYDTNYEIIWYRSQYHSLWYHSQYHTCDILSLDLPGPLASLCWPAFSVLYIYIPIRSNWLHLGMLLAWLGRRWSAYQKVLCVPHMMYGVLLFFLSRLYFFMDCHIIGKFCYIIGLTTLTYDIMVQIIVNTIYDILTMI